MLAQQLDLFGATLRPPQKIKEDIPAEPQKTEPPVIDQPVIEQKKISVDDLSTDEPETAFPLIDDSNGVPEPDDFYPELMEEINDGEHEPVNEILQVNGLPDPDWSDENGKVSQNENRMLPEDRDGNVPSIEIEDSETISATLSESVIEEVIEPEEISDNSLAELEIIEDGFSDAEPGEIFEEEELDEIATSEETSYLAPRNQQPALRGRKPIHHYDEEAENLRIPTDDILFKRQYYNMRETAAMFGVNQSLLRFWENEFSILQPKKNKKGDRYFRPADIKNLHLIYNLLRVRKFTMEGAKEFLQKNKKAADQFELVNKLDKLKLFLLELKATL